MARVTKDPETRRKEFIAAARELFMEKGFNQTSVSDITNKVGVSHGTFFYYFKSKNDIIEVVIWDMMSYLKDFTINLVANDKMDALQKMQTLLSMGIKSYNPKRDISAFFQKEGNAVMYQEFMKKCGEMLFPLITQIVEQGVEERIFDVAFPKETAEYIVYILGNMGTNLKTAQNEEEYYRKICALEILLTRTMGIEEDKLNLRG